MSSNSANVWVFDSIPKPKPVSRNKVCGRFGGFWGLLFNSAMFVGGLSARGAALLSPMIAAATLSFSSVSVLGNALRLRPALA